jgi:hypothetical protein
VFAGGKDVLDLGEVQVWRRAEINYVNIAHLAEGVDIVDDPWNAMAHREGTPSGLIKIAEGQELELLREALVCLDVGPANSTTHHRDA